MAEQKAFRSKKGFVKILVDEFGTLPLRRFGTMLIEWVSLISLSIVTGRDSRM
jgi:hypothetical protein